MKPRSRIARLGCRSGGTVIGGLAVVEICSRAQQKSRLRPRLPHKLRRRFWTSAAVGLLKAIWRRAGHSPIRSQVPSLLAKSRHEDLIWRLCRLAEQTVTRRSTHRRLDTRRMAKTLALVSGR